MIFKKNKLLSFVLKINGNSLLEGGMIFLFMYSISKMLVLEENQFSELLILFILISDLIRFIVVEHSLSFR